MVKWLRKRVVSILVMVVLVMSLCGCSHEYYNRKHVENNTEAALEYMKEKYGREFYSIGYSRGEGKDFVECYTEGMDPEKESARVFIIRENFKVRYEDTYTYFRLREDFEDYFREKLEDLYPNAKLFLTGINFYYENDPHNIPADYTVEQVLTEYKMWLHLDIYLNVEENVSQEDFDKYNEIFSQRLAETGHSYSLGLWEIDNTTFENLDRYNEGDVVQDDLANTADYISRHYEASIFDGVVKKR